MPRGSARLGPLLVHWNIPAHATGGAGGLEHLPSFVEGATSEVTWTVDEGQPGPPPRDYAAFYGPALLSVAPGGVRIWSPEAALEVDAHGLRGVAAGPCALPASIALHAIAAFAGLAHSHAALFRLEGHVVLAPGGTGAGKTSLALAVGRHGGELLADDAVYLDRERVAWPVRREPRATATTVAAHPGLDVLGDAPEGILPKLRVRAPVGGAPMPAVIDAILVPSIEPFGPTRIEPLEPVAVFPVLLGCSALAMVEGTPRRDEIIDLLAALSVIRAGRFIAGPDALTDPASAPRAIEEWLRHG